LKSSSETSGNPILKISTAAIFISIIARAIGHASPIYGGDEYAHLIAGLHRETLNVLPTRDPLLQSVASPLYLLFIDLVGGIIPDVSVGVRLFCAIAYCLLILWSSTRINNTAGPWAATGCVLLLGFLPSSAYVAGVMPDVPFYCAVVAALLGAVLQLPYHTHRAAIIAGVGLGVAYLIKPHAIAAIVATLIFIGASVLQSLIKLRSSRVIADRVLTAAIFAGSLYLTLVAFSFLVLPKFSLDPRYPLGVFYTGVATQMTSSGVALALERPALLLSYVIANLLTVLTVGAPFLFVLLLNAVRVYKSPNDCNDNDRRGALLFGWLLAGIPAATGMASFFAFTIGSQLPWEALRLHARYYAYIYPMVIVGALALPEWNVLLAKNIKIFRHVRLTGYVLLASLWPVIALITWWHNKDFNVIWPDNVETFRLFAMIDVNRNINGTAPWSYWTLLIGLALAPLLYILRSRHVALLTCLICSLFFSISLFYVTGIQRSHVARVQSRVQTGQLVRSMLSKVPDDQILIIGPDRYDGMAYVLYGMACACHVRQIATHQVVDSTIVPAGVRYIFVVDGDGKLGFPGKVTFTSPLGVLYDIMPVS
jgi:hypothetical protein